MCIEDFFGYTVFLVGLLDVEFLVQFLNRINQSVGQLLIGGTRQSNGAGDISVPVHAGSGVVLDDVRATKLHIAAAMRNMENSAGLMGQAVGNSQQSIGEGHASQALCNVHLAPCVFVAVIGIDKAIIDIRNRFQCQRIGEIRTGSCYIGLNGVGSEHPYLCVGQLLRHGQGISVSRIAISGVISKSARGYLMSVE